MVGGDDLWFIKAFVGHTPGNVVGDIVGSFIDRAWWWCFGNLEMDFFRIGLYCSGLELVPYISSPFDHYRVLMVLIIPVPQFRFQKGPAVPLHSRIAPRAQSLAPESNLVMWGRSPRSASSLLVITLLSSGRS